MNDKMSTSTKNCYKSIDFDTKHQYELKCKEIIDNRVKKLHSLFDCFIGKLGKYHNRYYIDMNTFKMEDGYKNILNVKLPLNSIYYINYLHFKNNTYLTHNPYSKSKFHELLRFDIDDKNIDYNKTFENHEDITYKWIKSNKLSNLTLRSILYDHNLLQFLTPVIGNIKNISICDIRIIFNIILNMTNDIDDETINNTFKALDILDNDDNDDNEDIVYVDMHALDYLFENHSPIIDFDKIIDTPENLIERYKNMALMYQNMFKQVQNENVELYDRIDKLENEIDDLKQTIKELKQENTNLKQTIEDLNQTIEELKSKK